jgi:hypothetical protein
MDLRSALRLTILALVALLAQPLGPKESAQAAQGGGVVSPGLPDNVAYEPVRGGTLFGAGCCPSNHNIEQGVIGDCYFMSSLGAIATWSPGIIQNAIHDNANGTYSVTLYKPASGGDPATAPLQRTTYTINGEVPTWSFTKALSNWNPLSSQTSETTGTIWRGANEWLGGITKAILNHSGSQFVSALEDVPSYAKPVDKVLWPALMEKAYAAMVPGGYNSLGEGGEGYAAMRSLTGASGAHWFISNESTSSILRTVTVKNVGSLAADPGHGIIAGIFEGKGLRGIEPRIQVCVTLKTSPPLPPRKCTPVCQPGYECKEQFGQSGVDLGNRGAPLVIEVLDIPNPGVQNRIVEFVQPNPGQCTDTRPCPSPSQASGNPDAPAQPVFISFTTNRESIAVSTISTLADMNSLLTSLAGKPVTAGTPPACPSTQRCVNESIGPKNSLFSVGGIGTCAIGQPCLDTGHEYYLKQYAGGMVTLGNPWGGDYMDVTLPLKYFMESFITISANYASPVGCKCSK